MTAYREVPLAIDRRGGPGVEAATFTLWQGTLLGGEGASQRRTSLEDLSQLLVRRDPGAGDGVDCLSEL